MTTPTEETKTPPGKASHDEVLDPQPVATVKYGGKDYQMLPLSVKAILKATRLVAGVVSKGRVLIKDDDGEMETIMKLLESLEEDQILELIALILREDLEVIRKGFKVVDAMSVITASMELEDIKSIFFQARQMAKLLRQSSKNTQ